MPFGRNEENKMNETISIITWIEKFNNGEFLSKEVKVQIKAGWYDWFCKDTSLVNKTVKLGNIIKQIKLVEKLTCMILMFGLKTTAH